MRKYTYFVVMNNSIIKVMIKKTQMPIVELR